MSEKCFFEWKFSCQKKSEKLSVAGAQRIETIIKCSKVYQDGKWEELEEKITADKDFRILCHRGCVSTYTSKTHVKRALSPDNAISNTGTSSKRMQRRSEAPIFNFKEYCLFCGLKCELQKDEKHPDRWRAAFQFRALEHNSKKMAIKEAILQTCVESNDTWASEVKLRLAGCVADLHAVDARYHLDCRNRFMSKKAVLLAKQRSEQNNEEEDIPYNETVKELLVDKEKIWNSVDINNIYSQHGGHILTRSNLIKALKNQFEDLVILSAPGYAHIITFPNKASSILRLSHDSDDADDIETAISKIAKQIKLEVTAVKKNKEKYSLRISDESVSTECSKTLIKLCAKLSPKLDKTPPTLLIGSIVSSTLSNTFTDLQVGIGVKFRFSKELVNILNQFQISCTYDELLRFKKSAATEVVKNSNLSGISKQSDTTLTQVIVDNFDTEISSQNGKSSTHSLAVLVAQTKSVEAFNVPCTELTQIKRIKKNDLTNKLDYETDVVRYYGPAKPKMPIKFFQKSVLPLTVLCRGILSSQKSKETDFDFINDVLFQDKCPEFNGYNTKFFRNSHKPFMPATSTAYKPLIDMSPAHPDTMMTALVQAQIITKEAGQEITVFTCDQQLYRVALHVIWAYPEKFQNVVLRLGGMHLLMSFVGSVGTLMANSGLEEIMENVFGGVKKMLSGKKFPQNVRALRLVVEELLRSVFESVTIKNYDHLISILDTLSLKSKTSKLWVDCLIKPVLLMMMYVRAEREGEWALHIEVVKQIMPYFFAAGHFNYARYGLVYLREMQKLPQEILTHFLKGNHVMHHNSGLWNGIWSDMFIETTFMRYGHTRGGIVGITLKPETLKTWALSLHICSQIEADIEKLCGKDKDIIQNTHKEEMTSRIAADSKDRQHIRSNLKLFIDPMKPSSHPDPLINIVSGQILPPDVNVYDAVSIGTNQMKTFEASWPSSFHASLSKLTVNMSLVKKHVTLNGVKVFDTNIIYSRVIGLQASSREVDIERVVSHELSPVPTSMFTDLGEMRICKSKSNMKKAFQVTVSDRRPVNSDTTIIIDGSALMWCVHWPEKGSVQDYINEIKSAVGRHLKRGNVHLVFDRYAEYSTKDCTRSERGKTASRSYQLSNLTLLPPRKIILTEANNKRQLINLICHSFIEDQDYIIRHNAQHKLVITGEEGEPHELYNGKVSRRKDLETTHEEADTIIVQQAISVAKANKQAEIIVISDDTDVFLLLLYFCNLTQISNHVFMESVVAGRVVIDIIASLLAHQDIIPDVLAAHAISGCDTTAMYYGIGKTKVIKTLKRGYSLSYMGQENKKIDDIASQAAKFITACYGKASCDSTSEARVRLWAERTACGRSQLPPLRSLPPTNEAFIENVKRAHLQTCIWQNALKPNPPNLQPTNYGYFIDANSKRLLPVTLPEKVEVAPSDILQLIRCSCSSTNPCSTKKCGCRSARLPCTMFCMCHGNEHCCSELTPAVAASDDEDENEAVSD